MHELGHDLEGQNLYEDLKQTILDYDKGKAGFEEARANLTEIYTNYYKENNLDMSELNIDNEAVNDILGQMLGDQKFINKLSMEEPNLFQKIVNWLDDKIELFKSTDKDHTRFLQEVRSRFEEAYRNSENLELGDRTNYAVQKLKDGSEYFQTENNLFLRADGSEMSQREIFNSLVGKKIKFNDGIEATIKAWLPGDKEMYDELFKRRPAFKNVKNIKKVNTTINKNIIGMLENTDNISPNEPDYKNRHAKNDIVPFDTRRVGFYDGKKAYNLDFSIAKLKDGTYVAYAKRFLRPNNQLLNKIKKEAPTGKSRGVLLSKQNIPQNQNNIKQSQSKEGAWQERLDALYKTDGKTTNFQDIKVQKQTVNLGSDGLFANNILQFDN